MRMIFEAGVLLAIPLAAAAPISAALAQTPYPGLPSPPPEADAQILELSLEEAVAVVRERSFRAARAHRSLDQSELRYDNARAQYLPRLDTRLAGDQSARGYTYDSERFANFQQPTRGYFVGTGSADLSMPIDVGGVIKRQVRQADIARDMSGKDLANTMLDLTLEVQSTYLNALRAQTSADADEALVKEIEELLARAGPGSSIAAFLEVELGNGRQSAQYSRENADNAQDGLKQLLRMPPEARLRLTTDFRDQKQQVDRDGLLDRALAGRPDVQSALLRVRQAETSVQQATDSRKPAIRVGAFASQQFSGKSFYGGEFDTFRQQGAGLNVSVPFLNRDNGQIRRNKEIARILKDQADADVQELRERVAFDLRQQLLAVTRSENRIRNIPDRRQAREALDRAEAAMLEASPDDQQALLAQVSNARQAWRAAETANAEAYIDYNNAVFRLRRIVGEPAELQPEAQRLAARFPVMTASE